jgi:hypothetical protein
MLFVFSVIIISAFWGCGGESSKGGGENVAGKDIINMDIQNPADTTVQDIQGDIESKDVVDDVKDISDVFDGGITDTIEDIIVDGGCKDECTVSVCKDNSVLNSCGDWDNDGCKEYKEVVCEKGCENGACKTCIPNCTNKECGDDGCGGSCGSCGNNSTCSSNKCVCNSGYADCNNNLLDGCEVNLTNDSNNCGSCGNSCGANGICTNSQCECIPPYLNCNGLSSDGCEVNKNTDVNNCGGCGKSCGQNSVCNNGFCGCKAGYDNCDNDWSNGCEVDLNSILSCGTSCSNTVVCSSMNGTNPVCDNGVCKLTCNVGYADCNAGVDSSDGCETKLDSKHLWSNRFGGSSNDWGSSVAVDGSGNVFIAGGFYSSTISFGGGALPNANAPDYIDIFLAKFDSNGNHLWSKSFGGRYDDVVTSVAVDSSGNVYITGNFKSSTIDFGGGALKNAGYSDIFLAKFDRNGNHKWSKRFGGSSDDYGNSVSIDSSGNVYITGSFYSSTIDFGGGALTNAGSWDIFLAKFDSNGNHLWSKRFGGSNNDVGTSVSVDSSGNVYITGYFYSSTIDFGGGALTNAGYYNDIFLAKFDSNGYYKWSMRFGGSNNDWGTSVSVDSSGNVYITGGFKSSSINFGGGALTNVGSIDTFIVKFDSNGNHKWSKSFGGSSDDEGNSVFVDSSGNVNMTGYFKSSSIDFGGGALTNMNAPDYSDIFTVRFDSNGNYKWGKRFGGSSADEGYSVSADSFGNLYETGYFQGTNIDFGGCPLSYVGGFDIYLIKYAQ